MTDNRNNVSQANAFPSSEIIEKLESVVLGLVEKLCQYP